MYGFKIFRLFLVAIIITYFCGCFWYLIIDSFKYKGFTDSHGENVHESFYYKFEMENRSSFDKIIVSWYYSMTTLTTVGYGDYYPVSNIEIFVAVGFMLCGVVFFSYVMSSVIDIINNEQKKNSLQDKAWGLRNWLTILTRYTNKKPLPLSLYN